MTEFKQLRTEMALDDWHDKWGTAMHWHFRICDVLRFRGSDIPTEWAFEAGLGWPDGDDILSSFDDSTLTRMGNVLSRYVRLCDRAGLSY